MIMMIMIKDNKRDDGYEMKEEYKIEVDSNYNNDVIPEEASTSGEGKKKQHKIAKKLTMYKKNQQENKNSRISMFL